MAAKKKAAPAGDVIAKVRALLARAADPGASEEERRTSAVIAARLMREHGITLSTCTEGATGAASTLPPPVAAADVHAIVQNVERLAGAFSGPGGLVSSVRELVGMFRPVIPPRSAPTAKKRHHKGR